MKLDKEIINKFVQDPDWPVIDNLIREHIQPLFDVRTIDATQTSDEVHAEVKARQKTIETLGNFLYTSGVLQEDISKSKVSFK